MVALTGGDLTGTSARIRARHADGSWGQWYESETLTGHGATTGPRGTDPVFVGKTTTVQIAVSRPPGAPLTSPPKTNTERRPGLHPGHHGTAPAAERFGHPDFPAASTGRHPVEPADRRHRAPGQAPTIIARAQWGADEAVHCGNRPFDQPIRAAVVHHTAESNDYEPQDSAAIVRSIYAYHTQILGWCDIAYNALVDKYGQVFEGRAGALIGPVQGDHTGGFNRDSWGVAMIGNFDDVAPTPIQLHTLGRLIGWRLGLDHINPRGTVALPSAGGENTNFPVNAVATLPTDLQPPRRRRHRLPRQRRLRAARRNPRNRSAFQWPTAARRPGPVAAGRRHLRPLAGDRRPRAASWAHPPHPKATGEGGARYANFDKGAMYWSPDTGPQPVTGAIYDAWASLGYERGALGLPTSSEIQEPQWVKQNFQHGTLNFDRLSGRVSRVIDGVVEELPPPSATGPPVQLERFSPVAPAA